MVTILSHPIFHRLPYSVAVMSGAEIVPALHGTACPRFPGSASCSPRPTADGWSTKGTHFKWSIR